MARRWNDPAAFRADPAAAEPTRPSRRQTVALISALALVAGAIAAVSFLVRPDHARSFDLFRGSLFLADDLAPVSVDLASGKPTVRLVKANEQVGAKTSAQLSLVPLAEGSLLLDNVTGEFNVVDSTGFVMKPGGGVPLAAKPGSTDAEGIAAGTGAYILQTGSTGTSVYLVGRATVARAIQPSARVVPSAYRALPDPVDVATASASAGNGQDLWVLGGAPGERRAVRQLSVPARARLGATLTTTNHGTAAPVSAIGTAGSRHTAAGAAIGGGANVTVGIASPDRIQLYAPGAKTARVVRFPAPADVRAILPASNQDSRLSFLLQTGGGWELVSVNADGTGLRGPTRVAGISDTAALAPPAQSDGNLYTADRDTGVLTRIAPDGVASPADGQGAYPLGVRSGRVVETAGFRDIYVVARGSRVFVNSPGHVFAVALFTDDTRPPLRIDKSAATAINAQATVDTLSQGRNTQSTKKGTAPPSAKPKSVPQAAVNNKIDCSAVTQRPHEPSLFVRSAGSRSVDLAWTYPTLTNQDCVPSTYQIAVRVLSASAPKAPGIATVQGQRETTLAGLFPSTQYEVTVTAFINGRGTTSPAQRFTTGPEGPAAPTGVRAVVDRSGTWTVTWSSCGSVRNGCVPADTWRVVPRLCDGLGLSNPPSPVTVPADPSTTSQPPAQVVGGDALLGRGLSFQVFGTGTTGREGSPSASTACVTSWSPPNASALTLTATAPANIASGGTGVAKVSLDLGANPVRDLGGVGARVVLTLSGPGGYHRTRPFVYSGSGAELSTTFDGIQPGASYTATATVSPPGHPEAAVTITAAKGIVTVASWPALSVSASCPANGAVVQLTCDLKVQISGVSSASARGERFDVIDSQANSQVRCGNAATSLDRNNIDPADGITVSNLPLLTYNGTCTVTVVLRETSSTAPPQLFGGQASPPASTTFTIGQASTYNGRDQDFTAAWDPEPTTSQVRVRYQGTKYTEAQLSQITTNWTETLRDPSGNACGTANDQPTSSGIVIRADVACVNQSGSSTGWTVDITYADAGTTNNHALGPYNLSGTPPGYKPCAPLGFSAAWNATRAAGVQVTYSGTDLTVLAGCSNFEYTLLDETGKTCGSPDIPPNPPAPSTILVSGGCTPAPGWSVRITWTDTAGKPQKLNPDYPLDPPPPN